MGGYAQAVQHQQALKDKQRNTVAALYLNAIQTPLPKTDDPAYKEALQRREDLMRQYVSAVGPEQHASFGARLHGLIFGEPDVAQPVHGNAPEPPPVAAGAPPAAPAPQSDHPFAHNPVYAKIQEGLDGLGKHLKAFAHPLPPQAGPDYATLAAAPTEEERKQAAKEAETAQAHKYKMQEIEAKPKPRGSVEQQRYDALARGMGFTGYDDPDMPPEKAEGIANQVKRESLAPKYLTDPKTGFVSRVSYGDDGQPVMEPLLDKNGQPFGGFKPDKVTIRNGFYTYTNDLTGQVVQVPVTTETRQVFGPNVPTVNAPASSQAPSLSTLNAGIHTANAHSKKLNKGKPVSLSAPQVPGAPRGTRVIGTKPSMLNKSDAAQYTKVAEDANNKEEAFKSAQKALAAGSTPSSDQELIYAWVRSNVQGAGRMTQAEFRQAASVGSLDQRAQNWYNKTLTGKLTPEIEQMMFADIKRSYETSQQEADELRKRLEKPGSTDAPPPTAQSRAIVVTPGDMK